MSETGLDLARDERPRLLRDLMDVVNQYEPRGRVVGYELMVLIEDEDGVAVPHTWSACDRWQAIGILTERIHAIIREVDDGRR